MIMKDILKRVYLKAAVVAAAVLMPWCVAAETVSVTPGGMAAAVRSVAKAGYTELVLTGSALPEDMHALRGLPAGVRRLDLSQLSVAGGEIPAFAMMGARVEEVVLPNSVTAVGEGAFAGSALRKIVLPTGVRSIGRDVFRGCLQLVAADLSKSTIAEVPSGAFAQCAALRQTELPTTAGEIGADAYCGTALVVLNLRNVARVGSFAFAGASQLSEVQMRNNTVIGEGAFYGDGQLTALGGVLSSVPDLAFTGSGALFNQPVVADAVVGEGAFANCDAAVVVLGSGVREIRRNAFRNARALASVDVTALGTQTPALHEEGFAGLDLSKIQLIMSAGSESVWKSAPVWREFDTSNVSVIVNPVDGNEDIRISTLDGAVHVVSAQQLQCVTIYTPDGRVAAQQTPPASVTELTLPAPSGVIIVEVRTASTRKVLKLDNTR